MRKSKHFRKDVILARIIAAVILLVLIGLLVFGISLLKKSSGEDKNTQNSQNTEGTENLIPGDSETEEAGTEDVPQTEDTGVDNSTEENDDTTIYEPAKTYVKIKVSSLRLREEPNTSCATLASIPKGTKLEVIEKVDIWYKVSYNGKVGYVSGTYVEVVEE